MIVRGLSATQSSGFGEITDERRELRSQNKKLSSMNVEMRDTMKARTTSLMQTRHKGFGQQTGTLRSHRQEAPRRDTGARADEASVSEVHCAEQQRPASEHPAQRDITGHQRPPHQEAGTRVQ